MPLHLALRRRAGASIWLLLLLLLPLASGSHAEPPPRRRALLVGCSRYPHLPAWRQLYGPDNDVTLMASLLGRAPFSFATSEIQVLSGWPAEESRRPTKANILRQLGRLANEARPGDQIVILLAGHGSQQPANADDPGDSEPDGLDEIFLAADVGSWNGQAGQVDNAIVDDDLRRAIALMQKNGAFVWAIFDSCHSGTMTRGGEVERYVPPQELGVPIAAVGSRGAVEDGAELSPDAGGVVAFYAAQANQTTPEMPLPDRVKDPVHGLFTYTLASVLRQSDSRLTYRELAAAIAERYRDRRGSPTPLVEGGALDREVLGVVDRPGGPERPTALVVAPVAGHEGRYRLSAGDLDGLTTGTVLTVPVPVGAQDSASIVAHLRVDALAPLDAEATVVEQGAGGEWRAVPADRLPRLAGGASCTVVFRDYGPLQLPVAVQTVTRSRVGIDVVVTHAAGTGPARLEEALAAVGKGGSRGLLARVDTAPAADCFLRLRGEEVTLVPSGAGAAAPAAGPQSFALGRLTDPDLAAHLEDGLRRIARALHLRGLAAASSRRQRGAEDVRVELQMLRLAGKDDAQGAAIAFDPRRGRAVRPGDWIGFRLHNPSRVPIDVTLLYASSAYEIRALFPLAGDDNRLAPGETRGPLYPTAVNAATLGLEDVVAIAVRGEGAPRRDFTRLAQPRLVTARGSGGGSPLERLLDAVMYGTGNVRGIDEPDLAAHDVQMVTWSTLPPS